MPLRQNPSGGPTVLLVEDEPDTAEAVSRALGAQGFDVRVGRDGPESLQMAKDLQPFAAIVDIGLPDGMDGYEVGRQLRSRLGPKLRLFALTGYGSDVDKERARMASFDAHMVKPADVNKLAMWLKTDQQLWLSPGRDGAAGRR